MNPMTRAFCLSLMLCSLAVAVASADPASDAKHHFDAGVGLARHHEFTPAIAEFEASYRLNPLPEVRFNIALSQKALGLPLEAIAELRRYIAEAEARPQGLAKARKDEALAIVIELEAQLSTLQVHVPAGAELRVDDRVVGRGPVSSIQLDPGTHRVDASAPGMAPAHAEPVLAPGQNQLLELTLQPSAPTATAESPAPPPAAVPPPSAAAATAETHSVAAGHPVPLPVAPRFLSTTRGRVALGLAIGATGLFAAGAVTGTIVLQDRSKYRDSCRLTCDDSLYTRAHTLANTTDVLFGIGAAAAIASGILVVTRPTGARIVAMPAASSSAVGFVFQGDL
jgi:hypothetical protein